MSARQFYCLDCNWSNIRSHQLKICENCGSRNLMRESALLAFYKKNDTSIEMLKAEIARLHARIATLERIIEREAEKTMKAGMPGEQHD